ncbi:hypothetical protein U5922_003340 [Aquicoccus sp. G2-2]|uniref:hypothetical protein n=1 Tax=Aquicoccus sp. G2-2 TaxID=3092120 RepID=UPI002ADF5C40|nr:hypothetical protein [Aquicoccus sp. G2-2]MEA1112549.1 hypothetical protein [Aquicoccus sp. G2-2]
MKYFTQLSLEELWVRTLQEIDFLHDEAQSNDAEISATDINTLSRTLSALRKNGPLSDQAAGEIGRIEDLLLNAITQETLGTRNIFDGTEDPDHGAVGRVLVVPVLSRKGAALDALQQRFRTILAMRDLLAARVDAACHLARLRAAGNDAASDERAA